MAMRSSVIVCSFILQGYGIACGSKYSLLFLGLTQLACCAFGRVVLSFSMVCGFPALRAGKPHTSGSASTMLPQAKTRLCDAEWRNCVSPNSVDPRPTRDQYAP